MNRQRSIESGGSKPFLSTARSCLRGRYWTLLLLLGATSGCSDGTAYPSTAPIKGVVSYKNQPLADANVSFIPESGRPATGTTNSQGEFELTTFQPGDGAILGEHRVLIEKSSSASTQLYAEVKSAVPKVYTQLKSTPLRQVVSKEGDQNVRIDLKD
ncbi:hypothetical protein [Blastopirellula marina]|uniref:Carboxypeptidase regulatory-like domain-containing protein n=1 Tax=Blastopirellula marina TaxID=124 RepID=A0A2S8F6U5_9BACT|nr:hypothetical protein [Blastopirellula marina]PQO27873.1 hypothetical protein C5Y98_26465 [Blastopirellula marina]PTL41608.1 hypothetical protein C5Y97_26480 [Blastopirellula marina]